MYLKLELSPYEVKVLVKVLEHEMEEIKKRPHGYSTDYQHKVEDILRMASELLNPSTIIINDNV